VNIHVPVTALNNIEEDEMRILIWRVPKLLIVAFFSVSNHRPSTMAALNGPTEATYAIQDKVTFETSGEFGG